MFSWKSLFNRASGKLNIPENPIVMVSTVGDDEHRGDSHGFVGLGKIVAAKLGGEYRFINNATFMAAYPETKKLDPTLRQYFGDHGVPDILFSRYGRATNEMKEPVPYSETKNGVTVQKRPRIITDINEHLSEGFIGNCTLVSHHLTSDLLMEEGVKLIQAYPMLKGPLITVMMADNTSHGLAEALIPRIKDLTAASVFVCSGRRTPSTEFTMMMNSLTTEIGLAGMEGRVQIFGYDFQKEIHSNSLNPYIGLINKSDHIIVCGDSGSIISETLSAQRSVYLYQAFPGRYTNLEKQGLVKIFGAISQPLITDDVCVANPAERIADRIIENYKSYLLCQEREPKCFKKKMQLA